MVVVIATREFNNVRQEVGSPFVDNFCVTLRPCEHIQL